MYLVNSSSIKEFLFDAQDQDQYGVFKRNTRRDCVDVGNEYQFSPSPYAVFDRSSSHVSQFMNIENHRGKKSYGASHRDG